MDRRFLAANNHVAHVTLEGQVDAPKFVKGRVLRCADPVADLLDTPGGKRDKQLLRGQAFTVLDVRDGWAFGFDPVDGYVGYVNETALQDLAAPTHRVWTRGTHAYARPDFKSQETMALPFFCEVAVSESQAKFLKADVGWVPAGHLLPIEHVALDPISIAELFVGAPYLWGGNSSFGIDCSGLVQLALWATGQTCPRDSDLQERAFSDADDEFRRGDLLFWKGHVAMVVDNTTLLNANAYHMAVAYEAIDDAIARIANQGDGPVTSLKRPIHEDKT